MILDTIESMHVHGVLLEDKKITVQIMMLLSVNHILFI